jgi:hypothetical protein
MQRNPYGISSIWSLIIMVVILSGVIGVSIPLMSGGLPRGQDDAQDSATPAHSEALASQAGTPEGLVEAAGRSDGTVGRSSESTPVVSTASHRVALTSTATSTVPVQRPKALLRSADSLPSDDSQPAATPSLTPSVVQPTSTASSTAVVVRSTTPAVPTHTSSPIAIATPAPAARAVSRGQPIQSPRRQPTLVPQPSAAPVEASAVVPPELLSPAPDARPSGIAVFEWRPSIPLENGQAYEIVVWSSEKDPSQAWGIAPPTSGEALEINLDELFASGQFREGSLYWTVLVVQRDPYTRLTAPAFSPRRYLVYTVPEPQTGPAFQLP